MQKQKPKSKPLPHAFFERNTLDVARELIGKQLVYNDFHGIITETEAYFGGDAASHASRGKTPRNAPMFGPAGRTYIYLIYGIYHCLNIVTEAEGFPGAVLIRGLYLMQEDVILNGPGKLCRHLSITIQQNEVSLSTTNDFYVADINFSPSFECTPRIGISKAKEKPWRFVVKDTSKHETTFRNLCKGFYF